MVAALVEIADSRFQDELVRDAQRAGKLTGPYRTPENARNNRPERLKQTLARYRERGLFQEFPFGTDLTEDELVLKRALHALEQTFKGKKLRLPGLAALRKTAAIPKAAHKYLDRLELDRRQSIKERLLQRAVIYALASVSAI